MFNFRATFVRIFVTKNVRKYSNSVTLVETVFFLDPLSVINLDCKSGGMKKKI